MLIILSPRRQRTIAINVLNLFGMYQRNSMVTIPAMFSKACVVGA